MIVILPCLVSCYCYCKTVALPPGAMGWLAVCDTHLLLEATMKNIR